MCLAVPARIVAVDGGAIPMGRIDVAGVRTQECCLAYVPAARVGDYVVVQNGFAVEVLDPQAAAESLAAFDALGVLPPARGEAEATR
jgi:hydrogenase expression/formation protein HypC